MPFWRRSASELCSVIVRVDEIFDDESGLPECDAGIRVICRWDAPTVVDLVERRLFKVAEI
jgi:hypothetical protein